MIIFEPNTNNFQYEVLKPINETNHQIYQNYDYQINVLVNEVKNRGK